MMAWNGKELNDALALCKRTCRDPLPCRLPQYLMARYKYHQLLVRAGILSPAEADPRPKEAH
jgi:hypothetical protein